MPAITWLGSDKMATHINGTAASGEEIKTRKLLHKASSGEEENGPGGGSADAPHDPEALIDALFAAAKAGNVQDLAAALAGDPLALATATRDSGITPLHVATSPACIEALIGAGAKVDALTGKGISPLLQALAKKRNECVAALISGGADVNGAGGTSPLLQALAKKNESVALLLVEAGADLTTEMSGYLPLHIATLYGFAGVVEAILAAGADKNARTRKEGSTALHLAVRTTDQAMLTRLLAAGVDAAVTDVLCRSPQARAEEAGADGVAMVALLEGSPRGAQSALVSAAMYGDAAKVARILAAAAGSSPEARSALVAPLGGDGGSGTGGRANALGFAASQGSLEVVEGLLAFGADAGLCGVGGMTPLHSACLNRHLPVARALLDAGADASAASEQGETPLLCALTARGEDGDELVALLLERGAEASVADAATGGSVLHRAAGRGRASAVPLLVAAGASVAATNCLGQTALHVSASAAVARALLDAGAAAGARDAKGRTPADTLGPEGSEWLLAAST